MSPYIKLASLLFLSFCSILFYAKGEANTNIIISTPPVREVVLPPRGYLRCQMIPSKWHNGVWINEHRVCQYGRRGTWVAGYWQCDHYKPQIAVCKKWRWVQSYWVPSTTVVYNSPVVVTRQPVPSTQIVVAPAPPVVVTPAPSTRVVVTPAPVPSSTHINVTPAAPPF